MCILVVDQYTHEECGHMMMGRDSCPNDNPMCCENSENVVTYTRIAGRCPLCMKRFRDEYKRKLAERMERKKVESQSSEEEERLISFLKGEIVETEVKNQDLKEELESEERTAKFFEKELRERAQLESEEFEVEEVETALRGVKNEEFDSEDCDMADIHGSGGGDNTDDEISTTNDQKSQIDMAGNDTTSSDEMDVGEILSRKAAEMDSIKRELQKRQGYKA